MSRTQSLAVAILVVGCLGLAGAMAYGQHGSHGPNYESGHGMGKGMARGHGMRHGPVHKGNRVRHRVVRHGGGVPDPYNGMQNPLRVTNANIDAGAKLYAEHCTTCHGKTGEGDGEGGKGLNPKPANLAFIMGRWIATDDFLMWSVAEGGGKLKTGMPAFKSVLTEKERWQVVQYLRKEL